MNSGYQLLVPEHIREWSRGLGPGLAGALFGAGWWFWIDAIAASGVKVPFVQSVPGIVATVAMLMINSVSRADVAGGGYESMDGAIECRTKCWLFTAYLVSLGSVIGSVVSLITNYATKAAVLTVWPGVACLLQCIAILASGLVFFLTRSSGQDSGGYF